MSDSTSKNSQSEKPFVFGVTRTVFILGLVSLFTDISSEMLYPIIPLFLTEVLRAPVAIVGVIEGIAESTARLLQVFSGWLADKRPRRRPLVAGGYSLSAAAKPMLALAAGWPAVLLARFVDRVGKGLRNPPRDALIADSSPVSVRGRAYGFHRSLDTIGAVVGPLITLLLLFWLGARYRLLFLLAFIPAILGVLLIFLVRERARTVSMGAKSLRLSLAQFDRRFILFIAITLVFAIGNSSDVFLLIRARNFGFAPSTVVMLFVVYNVVYALVSFPAGIISDRVGRRAVMVGGLLVFAAVYLGFAFAGDAYSMWLLFPAYGVYVGMTEGIGKAWVTDLVPHDKVATALGVYQTAIGSATLVASTIAGVLWTYVSIPAPFIFAAGMALLAAVLFTVGFRKSSPALV